MPRGISSDVPNKSRGGGNFIRHFRLRDDGEFARFWFMTEGDDVYVEEFHTVKNSGGKGPKWSDELCTQSAFGQACKFCEQSRDDGSGVSYARTQVLIWVYETHHFYPEKPTGDKIETKKVKVNGRVMHVEEVNEPRLMRISIMHRGPIKTRFERYNTLLDRPFDWIRDGEKGSKRPSYTLDALDKEKMPKALKEVLESLPDLEDVALGKVTKLGGEGEEEEAKSYKTREIEFEEGDDDENEPVNEFSAATVESDDEDDEPEEKPKKKSKKVVEEDDEDEDEDPFA